MSVFVIDDDADLLAILNYLLRLDRNGSVQRLELTMAGESRGFSSPTETRPFKAHGKMELVELRGGLAGRGTFEPGWKWSEDVKPIAGTASCQGAHTGYVISGRMHV